MKYHQIEALFIKIAPNSWLKWSLKCCRFNSNDIYPIVPIVLCHLQHRDIFFTLWRRSRGNLLLFFQMLLWDKEKFYFLKETNEHIAVWEGEKTKDRALAVSGIKTCIGCKFERFCLNLTHSETIYINTNEHYRASVETNTRSLCKMVEDTQHMLLQK
jgi:Xaa-Pro aminopeptidase